MTPSPKIPSAISRVDKDVASNKENRDVTDNGAHVDPEKPISIFLPRGGAPPVWGEKPSLTCGGKAVAGSGELLPQREDREEGRWITFYHPPGCSPGEVVGPRWYDPQNPTQDWKRLLEWRATLGQGQSRDPAKKDIKGVRRRRSLSLPGRKQYVKDEGPILLR